MEEIERLKSLIDSDINLKNVTETTFQNLSLLMIEIAIKQKSNSMSEAMMLFSKFYEDISTIYKEEDNTENM